MDEEIRLTVSGVSDLPSDTRDALREVLARRARDLLDEAGRLEAEANPGLGSPMITPAMIGHADSWHRRAQMAVRRNKSARNWLLVSIAATFVGGVFVNSITKWWGAIGFVICFVVALTSYNKGAE